MNFVTRLFFTPVDWVLFSQDKKNPFLEKSFGPVKDEITGDCEIEGVVPEELRGEFARVGPNPRFTPRGGYHWFDGDGMIHTVRIKADKAIFSNRYVRTTKLEREEKEGGPVFENLGDMKGISGLLKVMNFTIKKSVGYIPWEQQSRANTSLVYHGGQLMALWEAGLPYTLKMMCDGVVETVGQMVFDGKLKTPFTAHPKLDPATGKLYGFGYQPDSKPYLTFFVLDAEGNLERQFPLPLERPVMIHDFSITETHAVFMDLPLFFDPSGMLSGKLPIIYKKEAGSRIGVIPLDAIDASSFCWYNCPESFYSFHTLNAWNIPGKGSASGPEKIQLISCDVKQVDLSLQGEPKNHGALPMPYRTTLDLNTGEVAYDMVLPTPRPSDEIRGYEFPIIRKSLQGRRSRYAYFAEFDSITNIIGVVKMDVKATSPEEVIVGRIEFGEGMLGGECPFIPAGDEEDDGYIATFLGRADGIGNSDLCIWNAKTMDPAPVARIKLPQRVPMGFHAIFMSEEDLASQRALQ